jgi:uncharacterized membrane protein YeiB
MLGMFISHYGAHIIDRPERRWPSSVLRFNDGRAMPLFVMLSGAGCVFICRHPNAWVRVCSRAALLLLAGLWLEGGLVAVILHFYALYLVLGLLITHVPKSWWLALALVVTAVGAWVRIYAVDDLPKPYIATDDSWWSALPQLGHPRLLLSHLMFTGLYPALPTMAFFLVGMWLATRDLRAPRTPYRLIAVGLTLAAAGYAIGWNTDDRRAQLDPESTSAWRLLSAAGHSQMPAWIVGSTGFALVVIGVCLWLAPRLPRSTQVLAYAGQLALTFYVVHVFLLRRGLRDWPWQMSPPAILAAIAGIYAAFVITANLWRRRFSRGPAEAILRFADGASRRRLA